MSIISYKEYKIANDKDYFVKNNVLLEMAQLDDVSTLPVYFDDDDIEFLSSFPTPLWSMALYQRYNTFLRNALFERCEQRINVEHAIYDEYVRIIKDFGKKTYSNTTKKEIEINFESIKNLEETKNLNISDEEINKIDKQTILDWIDNTVLVKKQNEEDLESIKIEDNKQFFELSKTHYITSSIKVKVEKNKICEKCQGKKEIESEEGFERCNVCYGKGKISVNPIEFKWDGKKFVTIQQQNTIKNISLNKKIIEITYDENYKNSIEGTTIVINYDYNTFDEEAIKDFAQLETYNIIKKYMPFPVKSNNFDPDKEDDYDFSSIEGSSTRLVGKIRAKSFIVRLIAKLEQDNNEPHFKGSGLEGSEGQYGYDLSGGFDPNKRCSKDSAITGFLIPQKDTISKSIKEFLSDNHHEYYGKTHEFKNYIDCLGEMKVISGQRIWVKSPDIVILMKYHKKDLYNDFKNINVIFKFIENETSENIKNMKEELIKEYGKEAYEDSIKKLKNLHDIKVNVEYTETERKQKFETIKDDNIKSKFKFAEEKQEVSYGPIRGIKKGDLGDTDHLEGIKSLIQSRVYNALRISINSGDDETFSFKYFTNGVESKYNLPIHPMDDWEDVNKKSTNGQKNIYIKKLNDTITDTGNKEAIQNYLKEYDNDYIIAIKTFSSKGRNIFGIIASKIANTIMKELIKDKKISIPHQKNKYLDHPAKSHVTHHEISGESRIAGNIVLPSQIKSIKYINEKGEVEERELHVALVLPSHPHRPFKSGDDYEYEKDDEFKDNTIYSDEEERRTGHYGDRAKVTSEENEMGGSQLSGARTPGLKLNSNDKPQKTYPRGTPQYIQAYKSINERSDMVYTPITDMGISNIKEVKEAIEKYKKENNYNIDEERERPIYIEAICEVFKSIHGSREKIAICFEKFLNYLEEQVRNNLRNKMVTYKEEILDPNDKEKEKEIKKARNTFKKWLKGKLKSKVAEHNVCENDNTGSRRLEPFKGKVGNIVNNKGGDEGNTERELVAPLPGDETATTDLYKAWTDEDKEVEGGKIPQTKRKITDERKVFLNDKTPDGEFAKMAILHIADNFKNIYSIGIERDELINKAMSLGNDYLKSKELFSGRSNIFYKNVNSIIKNILSNTEFLDELIDVLKNDIDPDELKKKNNIDPEPITTTPEPITATATTPPPEPLVKLGSMKDKLAAIKAAKAAQQQKLN